MSCITIFFLLAITLLLLLNPTMQAIFYTIGDHIIKILTPDAGLTKQILAGFTGFEVQPLKGTPPLLSFSGSKNITIPNLAPADILEAADVHSKVYTEGDFIFAEVEINGVVHKLKADKTWRNIETDLTLTAFAEKGFLKHFLVTAYGMAAAAYKTIKIHASVIEKDGKALLFLGPSGTGKSTHSRLWLQYVPGAFLLNDDEPIMKIIEAGSVLVYGAPWSGSTPCYHNASAKVAGIVHLYQSPENKLTRLHGIEALSVVMKQTAIFRSDPNNKEMVFNIISDILSSVPVYRLDCRPDKEAVALTEPLINSSGAII